MPASPTVRTPKKNGLWAVLLACAFFAAVFLLVFVVGKIFEKAHAQYEQWRARLRRIEKECVRARRGPALADVPDASDASAASKKDA